MADILTSHTSTEERKFLHDYSYTLFEDALREQRKLLDLCSADVDQLAADQSELMGQATRTLENAPGVGDEEPQI